MKERLNKILARAGVASRRSADRMIEDGRVTVNGQVVRELGVRVDARDDAIKVDGKRLPAAPPSHTYLMLNKPKGYVTTLSDPQQRPTVRDLLRGVKPRVFPVGRLDYQTEGLLLLTDDGELARDLTRPSSGVTKTYSAKVRGRPVPESLRRLSRGIALEGRRTLPARIALKRPGPNSWVEISIVEGRKHQVRKMLWAIGHPVLKLKRVRYDGLELGSLPTGAVRPLTPAEVARLKSSVGSNRARSGARRRGTRSGVID